MLNKQHYKIIIGFTGSVATIKCQELINEIKKKFENCVEIKILATKRAENFLKQIQDIQIIKDEEEWDSWKSRNDPVLHIELRKWADCLIVAPLSANTMAKIVNGLCDNLLTNVIRAWDYKKPLIVAPAMNTLMYENPITEKQIKKLRKMSIVVIDAISKKLMCGDIGYGAMEEPQKIAEIVYNNIIK